MASFLAQVAVSEMRGFNRLGQQNGRGQINGAGAGFACAVRRGHEGLSSSASWASRARLLRFGAAGEIAGKPGMAELDGHDGTEPGPTAGGS